MDHGKHQDHRSKTETRQEAEAEFIRPDMGRRQDSGKGTTLPQAEKLAEEQLESLGCREL